jgi:hypothetical protein
MAAVCHEPARFRARGVVRAAEVTANEFERETDHDRSLLRRCGVAAQDGDVVMPAGKPSALEVVETELAF